MAQRNERNEKLYENMNAGSEKYERRDALIKLKQMPEPDLQRALDTLTNFKQCIMETLVKKRNEYVHPRMVDILHKAIEKNKLEKVKQRSRSKMTI